VWREKNPSTVKNGNKSMELQKMPYLAVVVVRVVEVEAAEPLLRKLVGIHTETELSPLGAAIAPHPDELLLRGAHAVRVVGTIRLPASQTVGSVGKSQSRNGVETSNMSGTTNATHKGPTTYVSLHDLAALATMAPPAASEPT